jgi:hypothetical protein
VRLDWFKTAIVAVRKASFLTHAANEYRDSCLAVANTLCDLLVQAGITDENQVFAPLFFPTPAFLPSKFDHVFGKVYRDKRTSANV